MAVELKYPPLRVQPGSIRERTKGQRPSGRAPEKFPPEQQREKFGPKFERLRKVLERDPSGAELRSDPSGLAPERLLVLEVSTEIKQFATAAQKAGIDLVDVEEVEPEPGKQAIVYLLFPDLQGLNQLYSLWKSWSAEPEAPLGYGWTAWKDVFSYLRDIRPWGPIGRLPEQERSSLQEELDQAGDAPILVELELVFRRDPSLANKARQELERQIGDAGGRVIDHARIEEIAYDALLVEMPAERVRDILDYDSRLGTIAWSDVVMFIRAQARVDVPPVGKTEDERAAVQPAHIPAAEPILAILDGVPVSRHQLLKDRLVVEDCFDFESRTPVAERKHGTAIASLVIHGDLLRREPALERRVVQVPVLTSSDEFARDRMCVDIFYNAIEYLMQKAYNIIIMNVSLGNRNRIFQGTMSPWARVVDYLAWKHNILFVVSAGNHTEPLQIADCESWSRYQEAEKRTKCELTLRAVEAQKPVRRLLSPAESINALTVGALNQGAACISWTGAMATDPYPGYRMANPSSALGPGFARSVKPDVLMPGGRESLGMLAGGTVVRAVPARASRFGGLRVAVPHPEDRTGFTLGTSAAAALASRLAHRIHDTLEAAYGEEFTSLPKRYRASLLKAFIVHTAEWPSEAACLIRNVVGPGNPRQHALQKDNIRRYLGFGAVDAERAVRCAEDRVTFWAVGELTRESAVPVRVPLPLCMAARATPHEIRATLAWLTPVRVATARYRGVRLRIMNPKDEMNRLGTKKVSEQPDQNQTERGTVIHQRWSGSRAPSIVDDDWLELVVQREPDAYKIDCDPVPFALVVTIEMRGVVELYEQARARLEVRLPARA